VRVRPAHEDDLPIVMNVLDGAMLEVAVDAVRAALSDAVLVGAEEGRVLGALVREGDEIVAVAVRPGRRGQGVGSALVEAAVDRWGPLVAEFDERVRPFYASVGFDVERAGDGRFRGVGGRRGP